MLQDRTLPYFTQWTSSGELHPSAVATPVVGAVSCEIAGDRQRVSDWIGGELEIPLEPSKIPWVEGDEGLVAVHFRTAGGEVVRVD